MGGEKDVSPSPSKNNQAWNIPRAIKFGTFNWPPSKMYPHWPPSIGFISRATKHWIHFKGHQTWNILRAIELETFQRSSSWDLSLFLSFLFSLKAWIWIICLFIFRCDLQFEFLKTCSYNFPWEKKSDLSLSRWWKEGK